VEHQELRNGERGDRIGAALIVAELDKHCLLIERLDDSAHLTTPEMFSRTIGEERYHIEDICALVYLLGHYSTQRLKAT
jgi:hypothetical protein